MCYSVGHFWKITLGHPCSHIERGGCLNFSYFCSMLSTPLRCVATVKVLLQWPVLKAMGLGTEVILTAIFLIFYSHTAIVLWLLLENRSHQCLLAELKLAFFFPALQSTLQMLKSSQSIEVMWLECESYFDPVFLLSKNFAHVEQK